MEGREREGAFFVMVYYIDYCNTVVFTGLTLSEKVTDFQFYHFRAEGDHGTFERNNEEHKTKQLEGAEEKLFVLV